MLPTDGGDTNSNSVALLSSNKESATSNVSRFNTKVCTYFGSTVVIAEMCVGARTGFPVGVT